MLKKRKYYSTSNVIPIRIEWACGSKTLWCAFVVCIVAVILCYISLSSLKVKVKREKEIAFRAGYAKGRELDKLPKNVY